MTVLFCCSTRRALRNAFSETEVIDTVPKPAYQDDQYLLGAMCDLAKVFPRLKIELAAGVHVINMSKTEIWIPGSDRMATESLAVECAQMFADIRRPYGGMKVMGCAAQESLETCLGPYQQALKPAMERLAKAQRLGSRIVQFIEGSNDIYSLSVAW